MKKKSSKSKRSVEYLNWPKIFGIIVFAVILAALYSLVGKALGTNALIGIATAYIITEIGERR